MPVGVELEFEPPTTTHIYPILLHSYQHPEIMSHDDRLRVPVRLGNWVLQSNLGAGYSGAPFRMTSTEMVLRID